MDFGFSNPCAFQHRETTSLLDMSRFNPCYAERSLSASIAAAGWFSPRNTSPKRAVLVPKRWAMLWYFTPFCFKMMAVTASSKLRLGRTTSIEFSSTPVSGCREVAMERSFLAACAARFVVQWAASLAGGSTSRRLSSTSTIADTTRDSSGVRSVSESSLLTSATMYARVTRAALQKTSETSLLDLGRAKWAMPAARPLFSGGFA